jgi:cellulose synthase/poly-beta-1,6-N-acetylglucosamine synthase-like glycosyltransferase
MSGAVAPIVFAAAAALAGYILIGYPLLLAAARRLWARPPVRYTAHQPTVTAVIVVYNGERYLAEKLKSLFDNGYPPERLDIIVVSDGSTDRTAAIASSFAGPRLRLIELARGGKCAGLNAGIAAAKGEILLLTDVRQVVEPGAVGELMANFAGAKIGAVSGQLKIRAGESLQEAEIGLYWKFETWIRDSLSAIDSMFGATGPFYALRRELAVDVPEDTLLDDMYLPLAAFRRGYRLVMEPRAVAWDYPTTLETEMNRKVRTLAGNYQLLRLCPWLLGGENRMWLHFMSYKVGRLLLAPLLAAMLGASLAMEGQARLWLAGAQLAGYAAALADPWIPSWFPLKRVSSPARTFLTMMVAAVRGLQVFFVPARSLWKVTGSTAAPADNRTEGRSC